MATYTETTKEVIDYLANQFKKTPALPQGAREVIVQIAPWIAVIFGVLGILGAIGAGFAFTSPYTAISGVHVGLPWIISVLLSVIASVLLLLAFPGLVKRMYRGWYLLFWSEAVSIFSSLIILNIIGAVIGFLIGYYILFQIKSYYK